MNTFLNKEYDLDVAETADGIETTLSALKPNDTFIIRRVCMSGEIGKRIVEMGLNRGTKGKVLRKAPLGGPIEINIIGYNLSLRKTEAEKIEVTLLHG